MLFSPLAWVLFAITLLATLPGAFASPAPKRSKKQSSTRVTVETYPAIEGEEEVPEISVPRSMSMSIPQSSVVKKPRKSAGALGNAAPTSIPLSRKKPIEKFEVVPADKRGQVLKRMQLCQSLFVETGRAYDYRTLTTRELEVELLTVRQAKARVVRNDPNTLFQPVNSAHGKSADLEEKDPILNPDLSLEVE
jgi:hypothetical protein